MNMSRFGLLVLLAMMVGVVAVPNKAQGVQVCCTEIMFDTSLAELDLGGGPFPIPLAFDPTNALGDSIDGYGFVDTTVNLTLSSQRAVDPGPSTRGRRRWGRRSRSMRANSCAAWTEAAIRSRSTRSSSMASSSSWTASSTSSSTSP